MNKLRTTFHAASARYGGHAVCGSAAGLLGHGVHHVAALANAIPAPMMPFANWGVSALLLAAVYGGWHALRAQGRDGAFAGAQNAALDRAQDTAQDQTQDTTKDQTQDQAQAQTQDTAQRLKVLGVQAVFAVSAAIGGYALPLHQLGHHHHHDYKFTSDAPSPRADVAVQVRVKNLLAHAKKEDLVRWQAQADEYGWTLKEFLENVCITQPEAAEAAEKTLKPPAP